LTLFEVKGDDNGQNLFEFFASNEEVEYTQAKVGSEGSGRNIVGTSHDEASTPVGHYLRTTNYSLREVNHNHANRTFPSRPDIENAALYEAQSPGVELNIYIPGYGYEPYNSSTPYRAVRIPRSLELDEVIVKPGR